jgi:YHS domain-containing protein
MKSMMLAMMLALAVAFASGGVGWAGEPTTGFMDKPMPKQQVACPVKGGKINKDIYVDYQGQRVYFCCPECIPIFKTNPEAFLRKMREQGVVPEKSPGAR